MPSLDNVATYKAYRSAYWVCREEGFVMDGDKTSLEIKCKDDGSWEVPDPLPTCAKPANCTVDPPKPPALDPAASNGTNQVSITTDTREVLF